MSQKLTALVTGASSGIGECFAEQLAERGYNLILVARSQDKLRALQHELSERHNIHVQVMPADLSESKSAYHLADKVVESGAKVDLLINNAGVLKRSAYHEMDPEDLDNMVNLNTRGYAAMCRAFLPQMLNQGGGHIINVSSISAFLPMPSISLYASSKAFVLHLTEALSEEYKDQGVGFTAVCPSFTATPMVAEQQATGAGIPEMMISDPKVVVKEAIEASLSGKVIQVTGNINKLLASASDTQFRGLRRAVLGRLARFANRRAG